MHIVQSHFSLLSLHLLGTFDATLYIVLSVKSFVKRVPDGSGHKLFARNDFERGILGCLHHDSSKCKEQ